MNDQITGFEGAEAARDGTPLRHPGRPQPKYSLPKAYGHFRDLLKDKEETSHVFKIFESLPSKQFMPRVRALTLSDEGERLRAEEPFLPPILDDHEALRRLPRGTVAHAYCDFMESEGLTAAGLVAEAEKLGNPNYGDLVEWFGFRQRDTHDLMHVLTGYGRDGLGEQCVLLFTHGQSPSHGHLLIGYAGALNIKKVVKSRAPVWRACRQAHRTGAACPSLVAMSIRELLAKELRQARAELHIPDPHWYRECHRIWREEGIDPYDLLAPPGEPEALAA
jgi:ubiquinone biosynthesis protein COQ4